MLKITYTPDSDVMFYYLGNEGVGIDFAIEANKGLGDYGTEEENLEMENPDNYEVEELGSRDVLSEIEMLVNNKSFDAEYNGAVLIITSY